MVRVGIIGAGIAGLTLANLLLQRSTKFTVKVFEKSSVFSRNVGAGFSLQGGAYILRHFGFKDQLDAIAHPFYKLRQFSGVDGSLIAESDFMSRNRKPPNFEFEIYGVLRTDFMQMLADPLLEAGNIIHFGKKLERVIQHQDKVEVFIEDGECQEFDIVIGGDGIWSTLRNSFMRARKPVFSGYSIWFGVIKPTEEMFGPIANTFTQVFSPGSYAGYYPIGKEGHVNLWNIAKTNQVREENWELEGAQKDLLSLTSNVPEPYPSLVKKADRLMHFGMYHHPPLSHPWYDGSRICIMGDAAHASLPYLGQGANQAIEDALCLSNLLVKNDSLNFSSVFKEFYEKREPRVRALDKGAKSLGKLELVENPFLIRMRNHLLWAVLTTGFHRRRNENNWMLMKEAVQQDL